MNLFLEIGGVQVESPWKTVDINAGDNLYEERLKAIESRWWNRTLIKVTDSLKNIF